MSLWHDLHNDLVRDEGLRLKPYRDTVGKLTIGIGRNLDDVGISEAEAHTLCENDIARTIHDLERRLPQFNGYPEIVQRAVANMAFNLGVSGLLGFKNMIAALDRGDYQEAAAHALDSKWARQVGRRAQRVAALIREG